MSITATVWYYFKASKQKIGFWGLIFHGSCLSSFYLKSFFWWWVLPQMIILIMSDSPFANLDFLNWHYYSFKIFPRFWLAKSTRIIHHNKFYWWPNLEEFCVSQGNDVKNAAFLQVNAPLTVKTWGRGWAVLVVKTKNSRHFTRFKSKNYSWN